MGDWIHDHADAIAARAPRELEALVAVSSPSVRASSPCIRASLSTSVCSETIVGAWAPSSSSSVVAACWMRVTVRRG